MSTTSNGTFLNVQEVVTTIHENQKIKNAIVASYDGSQVLGNPSTMVAVRVFPEKSEHLKLQSPNDVYPVARLS